MGFRKLKDAFKKIDLGNHNTSNEEVYIPRENQNFDESEFTNGIELFSEPISLEEPSLYKRVEHQQPPKGCKYRDYNEPIQTNNFYNNLTLDDQTFPIWTQPYSIWYSKDPDQDIGLACNHTEASQRVFGPDPNANPAQFYFNPPRIKSFVFSACGLKSPELNLENHRKLSVSAKLSVNNDQFIEFPLVYGMGYITAKYNNMQPLIASQVGVQEFSQLNSIGNINVYYVKLFNQVEWSLYANGTELRLADPNHIVANKQGNSLIQLCRGRSKYYDESAGIYPISADLGGSVLNNSGIYKLSLNLEGSSKSGKSIMWCFPHHQESLVDDIKRTDTGMQLDSPTKGVMRAYLTNELIMKEELPVDINWEPWASFSKAPSYSESAKSLIREAALDEVKQDVVGMANIDSMYTSGKILSKFALILYVCHDILNDEGLTRELIPKVKSAIEIFAKNEQKFPLVYDKSWKGIISSAEPAADFGNSNYNDHHFHYGYHIHAIALVSKVDPDWLYGNDKLVYNYALTLIRDVANPVSDKYFPQFRSFDWFHGHSFAHGIFPSGDGKDEESSSEDYHFAYGMKLFAKITKDTAMEGRANLMLAVMRRSMNMYMLFSDDNTIQPKNFIKNKVAGITFENKLDFATYFGRGTVGDEWIHGIHMLPITPVSSYIRQQKFVKEEWDQKLAPIIDQIPDGWKGLLILNAGLFNPKYSWLWFARKDWAPQLIDNGMSRTWSMAFLAGIGGAD